jgi:integrase/recombinase XerD
MTPSSDAQFKHNYQTHLKHLTLKGLQPKTIEAYARAIRRIGAYFDHHIDDDCCPVNFSDTTISY